VRVSWIFTLSATLGLWFEVSHDDFVILYSLSSSTNVNRISTDLSIELHDLHAGLLGDAVVAAVRLDAELPQ
jgi:hypothetical protein